MSTAFCGRTLPRSTPFALLFGHLEAFSLPDQSQTIPTHPKAFGPQKGMDLPITEAWLLRRSLVNASNELRCLDTA